jgi:hypothetical protein
LMVLSHVLFATLSSASRPIKCPTWNARLVIIDFTQHVSWSGSKALARVNVFFVSSLGRVVKCRWWCQTHWCHDRKKCLQLNERTHHDNRVHENARNLNLGRCCSAVT